MLKAAKLVALLLALLVLPLTVSFAALSAQSICGARDRFLEQLRAQYGETPVGIRLSSDGAVLEVLTSETGSWTVIVTRPNGVSCVVATGEAWDTLPKGKEGPML